MTDVPSSTPLRLPLVTGYGTLGAFTMLGMMGMPAAAVLVVGAALLMMGVWVWGAVLIVVGAFFVFASQEFLREAWVGRPCDYVLGDGEVRILGGPTGGTRLKISDIDTDASGLRRDGTGFVHDALELALRDGSRRVVARSLGDSDDLLAFLDVVRAAAGQPPRPRKAWLLSGGGKKTGKQKQKQKQRSSKQLAPAEALSEPLQIVQCSGCGAPQVPAATATVVCPRCGAAVVMPELLRRRLDADHKHRTLDARSGRALARVLAQPSSRQALVAFTTMGVLAGGAWALALGMFVRAMWSDTLDVDLGWRAALFPIPVGVLVVVLGWRWLVARQTVQAVMLNFGALAPASPGQPHGCHGCGAPLAEAPGAIVTTCGYCDAVNVLGVDLPRDLRAPRRTLGALKQALKAQARERGSTTQALLGVVPIALMLMAWTGRYVLEPDRADRFAMLCDAGSCIDATYREDLANGERIDWMRAACQRDNGVACLKLGAWQHEGVLGLSADPAAALPLFLRACELRTEDACEIVAGLRAQTGP